MNGSLYDFVIVDGNIVSAVGNDTLEPQTNGHYNDFERIIDNARQKQVIGNSIDDKIRKTVDNAVLTVENLMHDAILTTMDNVVIPRVEMALRSITEPSEQGPNSVVQNPDWRDFTPRSSVSSRLDLSIDQDRNDETCNDNNFEDGDFPTLNPIYDWRAHTHHN